MCYAFYKNVIVVFAEIYFILFNGFSGQIYFSDWFTNFYNTFWSSWPMIINFTLDRDVERDISIKYPILYKAGHANKYMNSKIFFGWILYAIFQGAVIFWIPMLVHKFI
jgi:magnesium-transporting ATPase (P-type)